MTYFQQEFGVSFERTYGWAWLLKLQEELEASAEVSNQTILTQIYFGDKLIFPSDISHNHTTMWMEDISPGHSQRMANMAENKAEREDGLKVLSYF